MYHSITFGEKNTWDDWHLAPSSRPVFNPPAPKVKTLDIPGGDGLIDLTQALTGYPVYQNRTGSFEFFVVNDYQPWQKLYSDIMDYLHGRRMTVVLEDDPEYYYEGRFTVNAWKSEKNWSKIVIDYSVGPYKWSILSSKNWSENQFDLQNGAIVQDSLLDNTGAMVLDSSGTEIRTYNIYGPEVFKRIPVSTAVKVVTLKDFLIGRAPVCPVFTVSGVSGAGVNMRFINSNLGIDETVQLANGTIQLPELIFYGSNGVTLELWSNGSVGIVSIDFRQGRL